jgi:hypothetical protein
VLPNVSSAWLVCALLGYYEGGAFVFKRGTEAVARALLHTVVARGGWVLTHTPPFKVVLSDVPGQRRVKGERGGRGWVRGDGVMMKV